MMATLTWDNDRQRYYAKIDEGTLFVSGDAFAEAKFDRATHYMQEHHPEMDGEQIREALADTDEGEQFLDQAFDELNDSDEWLLCADGSDNADAWIEENK